MNVEILYLCAALVEYFPFYSKMQIFVRLLNNKNVTLTVMSAHTIENVKDMIREKEKFSTDQRKLKFKGKKLDDGKTLSYYNIQKKSTLYLVN